MTSWLIAVLALQTVTLPQLSGERRPYVHLYDESDHPGDIGTRDVTQDARGFIYVANPWGLMEFDGVRWELLPPFRSSAVAADSTGRIWVGGDHELGYLEALLDGATRYHSLVDHLPDGMALPDAVYRIVTSAAGIFFLTDVGLIRWAQDTFTVWPPDPDFESYFLGYTGSEILLQRRDGVIHALDDDTFRPFEPLASVREQVIDAVREPGTGDVLVALRSGSIVRWDGAGLTPMKTTHDAFLDQHLIEDIQPLRHGRLAVATRFDGVLLFNADGSLHADLRIGSYLEIRSSTNRMFEDRDGGLWLATDTGVIRVALDGPLNILWDSPAKITDVATMAGSLVVGTAQGIRFPLEPDSRAGGPPVQPEYFHEIDGQLIFRNLGELMRLAGGTIEYLGRETSCIVASRRYPGALYICPPAGGVERIRYDGASDTWRTEYVWDGGPDRFEVDYLAEEFDGTLWMIRVGERVIRGEPTGTDGMDGLRVLERHTDFPMYIVDAVSWDGDVYFQSDAGILTYDADASPPFIQDALSTFGQKAGDIPTLFPVDARRMLLAYNAGIAILERNGGRARATATNTRLSGILPQTEGLRVMTVSETEQGTVLYGTSDNRLVRYDLFRVPDLWQPFEFPPPVVRHLKVDRESRSVTADLAAPMFPLQSQGIGASPLFRYRFPPLFPEWSASSSTGQIELQRLPPDDYQLEVRAARTPDTFGAPVRMDVFVPPAWYERTDVRLAGILLLLGVMASAATMLVSFRTRQLRRRSMELENIVAERTRYVEAQKAELAVQADLLANLNKTKSRFFADISHELRTPLTLAVGPLSDLLDDARVDLDPFVKARVDQAYQSVAQMSRHVSQMLDLSRLEAGVVALDLSDGDLATCLERVARQFESQASRYRIALQIDVDRARMRLAFDFDKVQNVVTNLLSNALKFTPDDGTVTFTASVDEELRIRLRVSDSGIGMSSEETEYVFGRYRRVGKPVPGRDVPEGEGIGLALVRELVLLHEGEITISSEPGRGTTVDVAMQAYPAAEHVPANFEPSVSHAEGVRPRSGELPLILVIEDNAAIRDYVRESLEDVGRVIVATDGVQGMDVALESIPDIIVADVMMPRMDGYEFCQRIREDVRLSHVPVVLLTARVEEEARIEGMRVGADAHLGKPFSPNELRARVAMLRERQLRMRETIRAAVGSLGTSLDSVPDSERGFMEALHRIMERELGNASFSMDLLAEELNMSRSQLYRKTGALLDESPSAMLRELRLQRGRRLLVDGSASVKETAAAVGFGSDSSFRSAFRERFGYPPSQAGEDTP